jgi:hypothetical protein
MAGPLLVELDRLVRGSLIARDGDTWKESEAIDPGSSADVDDEGAALLDSLSPEARLAGSMIASGVLKDVSLIGIEDLEWSGHVVREDDSLRIVPQSLGRALRSDPRLDLAIREQLSERLVGSLEALPLLALGVHQAVLRRPAAATTLLNAFEAGLREDIRLADEASELLLPLAPIESLVSVARAWREHGDAMRSDRIWTELRAKDSQSVQLALEHAEMLANALRFDRALAVLESVEFNLHGQNLGLHGWCLSRTGRRQEGLAEMRKALDLLSRETFGIVPYSFRDSG